MISKLYLRSATAISILSTLRICLRDVSIDCHIVLNNVLANFKVPFLGGLGYFCVVPRSKLLVVFVLTWGPGVKQTNPL